jgi:hypothetical protein
MEETGTQCTVFFLERGKAGFSICRKHCRSLHTDQALMFNVSDSMGSALDRLMLEMAITKWPPHVDTKVEREEIDATGESVTSPFVGESSSKIC